ncbi:MAG: serine--tRNA ligase [Rhodospirillales bacterium]|nr:serine--tRNA ligase [Rhodospirillales bacterium]
MLDIRWICDNPKTFDKFLSQRGVSAASSVLVDQDAKRRMIQSKLQKLQERRNLASKEIGKAKGQGLDTKILIREVGDLKEKIQVLEEEEKNVSEALLNLLLSFPNNVDEDTPKGRNEDDNLELRKVGTPTQFDFPVRDHVEIGELLCEMDFKKASGLSGSRFVILSGALAKLERALGSFMLDVHTREFDFMEVIPPVLVKSDALYGTGQLPKFKEDLFKTEEDLWLIPTAEVPLTNMHAGQILSEEELPARFTALTPCFRSEAGAAGKDTRGMLRQHQFNKVELVSICHPEKSQEEHERIMEAAEEILNRLNLPYRVMRLCTGDIGFSAKKTYDLEVWLPGQKKYREISSVSNCGDFQARRMKTRFRPKEKKQTEFVHTLNGSGLAVGRCLIAVMENYQNEDGSIRVPDALKSYMDGLDVINVG